MLRLASTFYIGANSDPQAESAARVEFAREALRTFGTHAEDKRP